MSDALLDSLVSALGDKQLESAGERVQRARDAAREAEEAAASVRAQRTRAQITPVPRELLDTTQSVPAAVQKCAQHAQGKLKGARCASSTMRRQLPGCCCAAGLAPHAGRYGVTLLPIAHAKAWQA